MHIMPSFERQPWVISPMVRSKCHEPDRCMLFIKINTFPLRYAIMDYLMWSTIVGLTLLLLISYDIACQWHKNLVRCINQLPPKLQIDLTDASIRYAIPKKHFHVHRPKHSQYSFNFLKWVSCTYGEGIEAHWSHMNPVSLSTCEMGPGMRHETLNDHWGAWNWQKMIGFGKSVSILIS